MGPAGVAWLRPGINCHPAFFNRAKRIERSRRQKATRVLAGCTADGVRAPLQGSDSPAPLKRSPLLHFRRFATPRTGRAFDKVQKVGGCKSPLLGDSAPSLLPRETPRGHFSRLFWLWTPAVASVRSRCTERPAEEEDTSGRNQSVPRPIADLKTLFESGR